VKPNAKMVVRLMSSVGEKDTIVVPTLLVWGDHDPVGGVKVAQATARLIRACGLTVEFPWL